VKWNKKKSAGYTNKGEKGKRRVVSGNGDEG
jgi:hypothetical protein